MSTTAIKERLYQYAADLWGGDKLEAENFDPLVDLLFGAFAVELNRTRQQLQSSEGRITDRICQLLLPDCQSTAVPAHTILKANPVEPFYKLKKEDQFNCTKEVFQAEEPDRTETRNLVFSPTQPLLLVQAEVLYEVKGNKLTNFTNGEHLLTGKGTLADNEIFLGIKAELPLKDLSQLRFFVDFKNSAVQARQEKAIDLITFEVDGLLLSTARGYGRNHENPHHEWNSVGRTEGRVNAIYEDSFITAHLPAIQSEYPVNIPDRLYAVFHSEQLEQFNQNLLWIQIKLPAFKAAEWLNSIRFHLNAFPVCNRSLSVFRDARKVEPSVSYIPMVCDDYFLGVHRVADEHGNPYSDTLTQQGEAKYAVVKEGVARFDARDARELLNQLLVTMRDEAAAFTAINGFEYGKITRLKELLNQIEESLYRTPDPGNCKEVRYLKTNSTRTGNVFLSFWQTAGETGNLIPSGTQFHADTLEIKIGSAYSLTYSRGGENAPDEKKKISHLRSALLSRERLVTRQDFKIASMQELGKAAACVEVKPGFVKNDLPNRGMERSIEVWVYPAEGNACPEEYWALKAADLQKLLSRHSALFVPVRVKIKHRKSK